MGFVAGDTPMSGERLAIKPAGAETASTTHAPLDTTDDSSISLGVKVTAASGTTPTLVVVVEGSVDGSSWFEVGRIGANGFRAGSTGTAPSNFTAAAEVWGTFPAARFMRTRSIIGGTTPSFTYSVTADVA